MKPHMTGVEFANRHYAVPLLQAFFRLHPEAMNSEKDHRQPADSRDWDVLAPMLKEKFPKDGSCSATLEDHRIILFNTLSGHISNTLEKPNNEEKTWSIVKRSHGIQATDNWNHLLITERGYYSYVRNRSKLKHLGYQVDGVPYFNSPKVFNDTGEHFRANSLDQSSLWHLAQNWDGTPFLFIDLKDPPLDFSMVRLSYDWRCVQINTRDHVALDLSILLPKLPKKGAAKR